MKFVHGLRAAAFVLALTGCGDPITGDTATLSISPVTGEWALDGVGQWRVPASIEPSLNVSRRVSAGSLSVREDLSWSLRYDYRDLGAAAPGVFSAGGTYVAQRGNGTALTLRDTSTNATYTALVNADNTVDITLSNVRFRFAVAR